MAKKIKYKELREGLAKIVAPQPDFVYDADAENGTGCIYVAADKSPSCLIGHFLKTVVSDEDWVDLARVRNNHESICTLTTERRLNSVDFTHKARTYASHVQQFQDCGHTWSDALAMADKCMEEEDK